MQQRCVPWEFVALLFCIGTVQHCHDGWSFSLSRKQCQRIEELFLHRDPTEVPKDVVHALCQFLEWQISDFTALHTRIRELLRNRGHKLAQLYFVLRSDGSLVTVAYRT
ncbi:MAG: hypothetical protein NZ473_05805 [Candidatus Kapabacteria bacterium]|nr:hypothetical protein [Candidatus Kapabacteria bacterium]MCS7170164.1 hypothetical protein [Candidatus Kapabacteria bacterium]MDW7996340.1 hypothetical protein [Bacteroidota bacterium]MDW8225020.1 hypothetical protein [Bacteroidota bacterium]